MKKLLFPLAILGMFFFASCGGDGSDEEPTDDGPTAEEKEKEAKIATIPTDRVALYIKSSGTNCPPCGAWGWNVHGAVIEEAGAFISPFTIHSANFVSKDFINEEGNKLDGDLGVSGWPTFITNKGLNGKLEKEPLNGGSTEASLKAQYLGAIEAVVAEEAKAGSAVKWSVSGNEITVDVRTTFFEDVPEGEYYIAVWVDENLVQAPQAGYTAGTPYHKHVLRTALDGHSVYGVPLNKDGGAIEKGSLFETTHTGEFPEGAWDVNNTTVTALVWTVTGTLTKAYGVMNTSQATFE